MLTLFTFVVLNHRSPEADIIINEVLITGLLNYTCQVCDNLVFYFGYLVVAKNTPRWFPLLAGLYIGTVMTVWWTTYVFNGLFIDTNTDTYGNSFLTPTLLLYTWCNVAYNAFFTVAFVKILYRVRVLKSKEYGLPAQIVSTKCTIHFFTSSAGVLELYYDYIPIQAVLIYIIILSCSMHILFNFKIESWFKQRGLRGEGKDGSPAEHDSIGEASLRKTLNGRIVWKEAGPTTSGTAVKGWVLPSSGKGNGILRSSGQYLKKKVVVVPTTNN